MKKSRSPRFPFIPLPQAVRLLTKLSEAGVKKDFAPHEAMKAIDFSSMHGRAIKIFAAFRAYDLVDKSAGASISERRFSITETGLKILEASQNESVRMPFLQRAALSPLLFRRIWERNAYVSEEELEQRLLNREFTENGAKRAAKVYAKNREFANLPELSELPANLPERGPKTSRENRGCSPAGEGNQDQRQRMGLNLPLSSGRAMIPAGITEEDFQLLMQTLRLWKDRLIAG